MGIKHFFTWFRRAFDGNIRVVQKSESFTTKIDNLMIDMNGVFHESAQKVFRYGKYKLNALTVKPRPIEYNNRTKKMLFADVCNRIELIMNIAQPQKKLILCIDGVAPLSKQSQQRQRRFRSSFESTDANLKFNSNSITPGTMFMDHLSKYIDWHIRKRMSGADNGADIWSNLEVIFSNEKVPGEGEHKLIEYIRKYGNNTESYCLHGMDADLIMLALGTFYENFFIIRDDPNSWTIDYYYIDIGKCRIDISEMLNWSNSESKHEFDFKTSITDFILMFFMVGNDFLPHIPAIEIIEDGTNILIDSYVNNGSKHGHLSSYRDEKILINNSSLSEFLKLIADQESSVLVNKANHREDFFPDEILNETISGDGIEFKIDMDKYRRKYYDQFESCDLKHLAHHYLDGMYWVLNYYLYGAPNWTWRYKHHYAPFAHDIANHLDTYKLPIFKRDNPTVPFIQLLSVLPPKSSSLLPHPLNLLLEDQKSPLMKYCPSELKIDLSGKRREWEGIVLIPLIDYSLVSKLYDQMKRHIKDTDMKRNRIGCPLVYRKSDHVYAFNSYYGNIECTVSVQKLSS